MLESQPMNARQSFIFIHFKKLFEQYKGFQPFHQFFKNYCKANSALGSTDRKILKEIFYHVFRNVSGWKNEMPEDLFLAANRKDSADFMLRFYEGLQAPKPFEKLKYPFGDHLVPELKNLSDKEALMAQPLVWVRVTLNNAERFSAKYGEQIVENRRVTDRFMAYAFKNNVALDPASAEYEVQDLSSQWAAAQIELEPRSKVWDCCAGSGGKSLFMAESLPKLSLYASDSRSDILINLKKRFKHKRLQTPEMGGIDLLDKKDTLSFESGLIGKEYFDVIVADVPCSGSGTWAREPENYTFFEPKSLEQRADKQFEIAKNALPFLKKGGRFYYITCSLFEQENHSVVARLQREGFVEIKDQKMILGFEHKADNLFVACLVKPGA